MSEWAATSLSLTPVKGNWADVLRRIGSYFYAEHDAESAEPRGLRLLTVDVRKRVITKSATHKPSESPSVNRSRKASNCGSP
jgi:hypothetical protein